MVPEGASHGGRLLGSAEPPPHAPPQDADAERLGQDGHLRGLDELRVRAAMGVARDEEECGPGRRPPRDHAVERPAVHIRHVQITHHEVGGLLRELIEAAWPLPTRSMS